MLGPAGEVYDAPAVTSDECVFSSRLCGSLPIVSCSRMCHQPVAELPDLSAKADRRASHVAEGIRTAFARRPEGTGGNRILVRAARARIHARSGRMRRSRKLCYLP